MRSRKFDKLWNSATSPEKISTPVATLRSVNKFMFIAGSCSTVSAVTCDECLQLSPHCAWCTQEVKKKDCS